MNFLVLMLILLVVVFLFVPATIFFIIWFKSFNKRAIIVKMNGETLDDADFKFVRCKVAKDARYGEIIRFFPGSGYDITKRFESKYWSPMIYKGKTIDTITLFPEYDNYRPCIMQGGKVKAVDIDNSEFLLFKDRARAGWNDENKLYTAIVVAFVVFALVFGIACVASIVYMMKSNLVDYAVIVAKGVAPIA